MDSFGHVASLTIRGNHYQGMRAVQITEKMTMVGFEMNRKKKVQRN